MKKNPYPLLALILLLCCAAPVRPADRSPFEDPVVPENLFDYRAAGNRISITGLIATDTDARVILKLDPEAPAAVYSKGDRVVVRYNGMDHEYRVHTIGSRSMTLKALNGKTYEVGIK